MRPIFLLKTLLLGDPGTYPRKYPSSALSPNFGWSLVFNKVQGTPKGYSPVKLGFRLFESL